MKNRTVCFKQGKGFMVYRPDSGTVIYTLNRAEASESPISDWVELSQFDPKSCVLMQNLPESGIQITGPGFTPDSSLPQLGNAPRRKMLIEIEVPENFQKLLDNQWVIEREIHADRYNWKWAESNPTFKHYDGCPAISGKPVCTCGSGRSA